MVKANQADKEISAALDRVWRGEEGLEREWIYHLLLHKKRFLREVEFERLGANSKMCNASFFLPYFIQLQNKISFALLEDLGCELYTQFRSVTLPPASFPQTLKGRKFEFCLSL